MLWGGSVLAALGLLALAAADSPLTGAARRHRLGPRRVLPVADDARQRGGALSARRRGVHRPDGRGRRARDPVRAARSSATIFDDAKLELAGGDGAFAALSGAELEAVLRHAAGISFRSLALLPALLIVVFGAIGVWERAHERNVKAG